MAKSKTKSSKKKSSTKPAKKDYVVVSSRSYGSALKGIKIYFEGEKPTRLREDGSVGFGKNILETLKSRFEEKFRWIITEKTDDITIEYGIARVRTSQKMLSRMWKRKFDRERDVKADIIQQTFYSAFPTYFTTPPPSSYSPGALAKLLRPDIITKLTSEDKEALTRFLPDFISAESISSINLLKASTEIKSLKELAAELEVEIANIHSENWWQNYIQGKILIIQQGYIRAIEKMNISVGTTKFPDFSLVTHDNYLDILEIKKPNTDILRHDGGRDNYFFHPEISMAVIQVENYLANVEGFATQVRSFILDKYKIDLKVVRPRGIILAGDARTLKEQKQKDDLRLLTRGLKNVSIVTYDELLTRLKNYIGVLEQFTVKPLMPAPEISGARQNREE
jgi:hypothetical protein